MNFNWPLNIIHYQAERTIRFGNTVKIPLGQARKIRKILKAGNVTVIPLIYFQNEFQAMELRKSRTRENLQVAVTQGSSKPKSVSKGPRLSSIYPDLRIP